MDTLYVFEWNFTIMCGHDRRPAFIKVIASDLSNAKKIMLTRLKVYYDNIDEYRKLYQKKLDDFERHKRISKFVVQNPLSYHDFLWKGDDGKNLKEFWKKLGRLKVDIS